MKNVLITLGCSWTTGIGTSDPYHYMWPRLLGKQLGFDKLINLSKPGSSNSGRVKIFNEFIRSGIINQNDEILVIFFMTESFRFSFFKENGLEEFTSETENPIVAGYLDLIHTFDDTLLEQKFYVNCLESMCKSNNMDLILSSWSPQYEKFYNLHDNRDIHLFKPPITLNPPKVKNPNYFSEDYHPNELGQEWICNKMIEGIKKNHSKWYSETPNEDMEFYIFNELEIINKNKPKALI